MGEVDRVERIGGHLGVDFVNTLGGLPEAADDEYLSGYLDLLTWAADGGLLDTGAAQALRAAAEEHPRRAQQAFDRALALRAALDAVLRASLEERPAAVEDRHALQEAYLAALAHAELQQQDGRYAWSWPPPPDAIALDQPWWLLASQAVDLLRHGPLQRLSRCGHCRWLFLDTSKNHSRRWCSMSSCGARMKMRRYRATHRP